MKTVTISVSSLDDVMKRAQAAAAGKAQGAHFSYATPELLFRTFTTSRWQIIRAMTGAGAMSIRELSRRLERDVKGVHGDVKALLETGLLEHDERGGIVFPYDTVHVNFTLKTADLAQPVASGTQALAAALPATAVNASPAPRKEAAPRKREARAAGSR
ncbi:transcriptional regulator [Caballeronia sp. LZ035]|uniref:HVO_A0114 family putative DNA-binding protein n=1 Tax=Caballeronia sp. LZ035 TaxID=3038568 RepID=UPI002855572E|nr:transcriptional regulator [Caballeronia sp. LZ035]MDR5759933.1 transcriptional regulator [Caballeronia sp. LZ035]